EGELFHDTLAQVVRLDVTGSDFPVWTGAHGSEWSTAIIASPKNWVLDSNSAATDFIANDVVLFNDSASNNTVDVSGADVLPLSVTFANDSDTYQLTGTHGIAGTAGLVMNGTGTTI